MIKFSLTGLIDLVRSEKNNILVLVIILAICICVFFVFLSYGLNNFNNGLEYNSSARTIKINLKTPKSYKLIEEYVTSISDLIEVEEVLLVSNSEIRTIDNKSINATLGFYNTNIIESDIYIEESGFSFGENYVALDFYDTYDTGYLLSDDTRMLVIDEKKIVVASHFMMMDVSSKHIDILLPTSIIDNKGIYINEVIVASKNHLPQNIKETISKIDDNVEIELFSMYSDGKISQLTNNIIVSSIILALSMLNIFGVYKFLVTRRNFEWYICKLYGARSLHLKFILFIEYTFITTVSFSIGLLFYRILNQFLVNTRFYYDLDVALFLFIYVFIIVLNCFMNIFFLKTENIQT